MKQWGSAWDDGQMLLTEIGDPTGACTCNACCMHAHVTCRNSCSDARESLPAGGTPNRMRRPCRWPTHAAAQVDHVVQHRDQTEHD